MDKDSKLISEAYSDVNPSFRTRYLNTNVHNNSYGQQLQDLLQKYPIKNNRWMYHPESNEFSAEITELTDGDRSKELPLDPWNRPVPNMGSAVHDEAEGELLLWRLSTTVASMKVHLTIFND